jgi:uncharacterized protein with HEPN domain
MSREPRLRLEDIIEAATSVSLYIDGYNWETFQADAKTRDAVIRQLEVIGEAVKALPP